MRPARRAGWVWAEGFAPPKGASDKTSGKHITSMHPSASPGIPPELPAAHGPLPGDDETARLPLPVPMLSP